MHGDRERFLGIGMNDYLSKPVNMQALEQALSGICPQKASQ